MDSTEQLSIHTHTHTEELGNRKSFKKRGPEWDTACGFHLPIPGAGLPRGQGAVYWVTRANREKQATMMDPFAEQRGGQSVRVGGVPWGALM